MHGASKANQLVGSARWISQTDQLNGSARQTSWMDQFSTFEALAILHIRSLHIVAVSESDECLVC